MRYVVVFLISFILAASSFIYVNDKLTSDGEYQASLYYVGRATTNIHIVTKMNNGEFVSRTYVNSPALGEIATFSSTGYFLDDDKDGNYTFRYEMKEVNHPTIKTKEGAHVYLDMIGRVGFPQEESIKMIYHNKKVTIFDMHRSNNVIMYVKKHE